MRKRNTPEEDELGKKKSIQTEEEDDILSVHSEEPPELWIVSYADFMTIMCCFFILLVGMASFDAPSFQKQVEEIASSFQGKTTGQEKEITSLGQQIINDPKLKAFMNTKIKDHELEITLSVNTLFDSGSAKVRSEVQDVLDLAVLEIRKKNPKFRIIVEGHTDNRPLNKSEIFPSNWELSSARAASIIHHFEKAGFNPRQLVAIGYGDTRPIVANTDKKGRPIQENMQLNRRVLIRVLEPEMVVRKPVKLGLGVYLGDDPTQKKDLRPENKDMFKEQQPSQGQ